MAWAGILLLVIAPLINPKTSSPTDGPRITNIEVVAGEPFGVGKVTFEPGSSETLLELVDGYKLSDSANRVFYPVVSQRFLDKVMDATGASGPGPSSRLTIWFLVRGDQPLRLSLSGNSTTEFEAPIQKIRPNAFRRLVRQWWREYVAQAQLKTTGGELAPIVESYLVAMLAHRLQLETQRRGLFAGRRDPLRQTMDLAFDTETLKSDLIFELMAVDTPPSAEVVPLPPPIAWAGPPRFIADDEVPIEPLATACPAECFYLRFGNWQNQLWLKQLLAEYGGDLSRLIQLRGHKSTGSDRMLDQLALEPGKWDDLFGGRVIDDLAVVGTDTYVADGASIGILFHSKGDFFQTNLSKRRAQFAHEHADRGVTLIELTLEDSPATRLSSPDNWVRSFFVSRGNLHLVTTSESLARRFLQATNGVGRLSDEPSFRNARRTSPLDRDDTMFLFVSEAFFHNLLSPQYQIELRRRSLDRAAENILHCAVMASRLEGLETNELALLVDAGFLPPHFRLPTSPESPQDLFEPFAEGLGPRLDLPVADVAIDRVTLDEARWFQERAEYFQQTIGRFDPLVIALKRYAVDDQHERLAIDARIAPFAPHKYDWLGRVLGPPTADQLMAADNDVITLQLSLRQDLIGGASDSDSYQLMLAIQNEPVTLDVLDPRRFLRTLQSFKQIPGYAVAWPNPGILNQLPFGFRGRPDEEGYLYSRLLDVWRLEYMDFAALAFERERLEAVKEHWHTVPGERVAQARLRIGDLSQSHLSGLANAYFFQQSWDASLANVRLANQLSQQFGLDPREAWSTAEQLLGVVLVCPMGGTYELVQMSDSRQMWLSTAWPDPNSPQLPADFQAAIFQWFRGMSADVIQTEDQFVVHAILDVHRTSIESDSPLPPFDLFKGFEKIGSLSNLLLDGKETQPSANPPKRP